MCKNILAIDCSLKLTGVAISQDKKILAQYQSELGKNQAFELPFIVENLLKNSGLNWNNIDYISITKGPGYFTGLRVAAAYASALAYALGVKIIPVSTLDVLSRSFLCNDDFLTLVYAGHGYVYAKSRNLNEGEYSHNDIFNFLDTNKNVKFIISDYPEKLNINLEIIKVIPDLKSLCEIASVSDFYVKADDLKISYYRAPQGV